MKRIIALVLIIVCCFSLVACQSTSLPKGKVKRIAISNGDYHDYYNGGEFEYITEHIIKYTATDGTVQYFSSSSLYRIEVDE